MPEITVAITTHNLERYIVPCLEELLGQTYQDFEILVYDDFSTDRTRALLEEYRRRYPDRLHVILGERPLGSPARSRNAVLDSGRISGRYLVFLDGDDNIEPNYLQRLHTTAVETGAEITLCAYDRFENETGHVLCQEMRGFPAEITLPVDRDILAFLNGSLWNKLFRVSVLDGLRIPDFPVGEDLSFQLHVLTRCRKIACIDEILIHYRVRAGSIISNTKEETMYAFARELESVWKEAREPWLKNTVELIAFIHIGISMTSRAYDNPDIRERDFIRWVMDYFAGSFHWFSGNPWFRLSSLKRHGVQGLGVWGAKVCYRLHLFPLFLWAYKMLTRALHIDIKF